MVLKPPPKVEAQALLWTYTTLGFDHQSSSSPGFVFFGSNPAMDPPGHLRNMFVLSAVVVDHEPESFWLKAVAPWNAKAIVVALRTSHADKSQSNAVAPAKAWFKSVLFRSYEKEEAAEKEHSDQHNYTTPNSPDTTMHIWFFLAVVARYAVGPS